MTRAGHKFTPWYSLAGLKECGQEMNQRELAEFMQKRMEEGLASVKEQSRKNPDSLSDLIPDVNQSGSLNRESASLHRRNPLHVVE